MEENKSSIRLHELGPRLTFQLIKIEDDLMTGEVLFHEYVVKTEEELAKIKKRRADRLRLKEQRKKIQQENKEKKEDRENENKKSKNAKKVEQKRLLRDAKEALGEIEDDDADYYRDEIGADPEKELFDGAITTNQRKRPHSTTRSVKPKKPRVEKDEEAEGKQTRNFGNKKNSFGSKVGKFNRNNDEDNKSNKFRRSGKFSRDDRKGKFNKDDKKGKFSRDDKNGKSKNRKFEGKSGKFNSKGKRSSDKFKGGNKNKNMKK